MAVEVCPEQPCILRCGSDGVLLLHVDDVLIHGSEQWISGTLIPSLEKEFKLTCTMVSRQDGGALEFLKGAHLIEPHASATTERFANIDGNFHVLLLLLALTPCPYPSLISYLLLAQQSTVRWLVLPCTWHKSVSTCNTQQKHLQASYSNQQNQHGMRLDVW